MALLLSYNSSKRILTFRTTSKFIGQSEKQLEELKAENERLKSELEYKKSQEFKEAEIRNKLGLAKEGEAVVIVPREDEGQTTDDDRQINRPNWRKWKELFFGT